MATLSRLKPTFRTVLASGTRTSTSNSALSSTTCLPLTPAGVSLILDVTAASGTSPTLDVALEISPDGGTTWIQQGAFTQATAANQWNANFLTYVPDAAATEAVTAAGTFFNGPLPGPTSQRILYTIGGTNPSFTFAVYGFFTEIA